MPRRRRRPLLSADAIAGNEDLMTEILIRLPAKSLCRFKCVSKRWYYLISHPNFSLLRMPHSVSGFFVSIEVEWICNIPSYKYVHFAGKRPRRSPLNSIINFVTYPSSVRIMDSCNGLLLVRFSGDYSVYNPTTKQFSLIPPPFRRTYQYISSVTLAFDPSRASHYKIVFLWYSTDHISQTYQIEIYSPETYARRLSGDPFTSTLYYKKGVFFNNMIHWPSDSFETWLLFDVDQESIRTIPMPTIPNGREKTTFKYIGQSQTHMHLIFGDNSTLDVLEMECDFSKLSVKYRVHLDDFTATFPDCLPCSADFCYFILHLLLRKEEEESALVLYIPGMVVSYSFKHKTLKKLCNLEDYGEWADAHQYIETLCI